MKKVIVVLVYAFTVLFFLNQLYLTGSERDNYKKLWRTSESRKSKLQNRLWDVSCANIIMVNHMCERDQRRMKKNKDYLDIIDKIE